MTEKRSDNVPFTCTLAYDRKACGDCSCATCYKQEFCDHCTACGEEHANKRTHCYRYEGAYNY